MRAARRFVKTAGIVFFAALAVSAVRTDAGEAGKPRAVYFYNPSCRLCTKSNAAVSAAEEKYGSGIEFERVNNSDPNAGVANMDRMFGLLDALGVPEDETPELAVFLGFMETGPSGTGFRPVTVLKNGDEIVEKLDEAIRAFLDKPVSAGENGGRRENGEGGLSGGSRLASFPFSPGAGGRAG